MKAKLVEERTETNCVFFSVCCVPAPSRFFWFFPILIFSQVHDRLEVLPNARHWRLYALHSQMPTSQQRDVFLRPPRGTRKVNALVHVSREVKRLVWKC